MAFSFRTSGFGFQRTRYCKTENAGFSRGAGLPSGPVDMISLPRAMFSLRSWRLCERLFLTGHERKRGGEADRGRGLPHSYQPRTRPAGIGLRSGLGIRTGETRTADGAAA